MNGLVIVLAIVLLAAGYLLYGRWLAKTWGIDPEPTVKYEDGGTLFLHQIYRILTSVLIYRWCRPCNGTNPCQCVRMGTCILMDSSWWIVLRAVQDFGALYASVKNEGKSMGMIIEKYIGKMGRKLSCYSAGYLPFW